MRKTFAAAAGFAAVLALLLSSGRATAELAVELGESRLALPEGFEEIPSLLLESSSKRRWFQLQQRQAFGDPAAGAFVLTQEMSIDSAELAAEEIHSAIAQALELPTLTTSNFVIIAYETRSISRVEFSLEKTRGTVVTILRKKSETRFLARSAACFYNDREPVRSQEQCTALLAQFEEEA